ncbi:type I DNA topoisomerase [soil metagenome]
MATPRKKSTEPTEAKAKPPKVTKPKKVKAPAAETPTGVEPAAARKKRTAAPTETATGKKYDLVIVESPAKAKTINKYLGSNFKVLASYGHVRDLATNKKGIVGEEVAGIRIDDGWKLRYVSDAGKKGKAKFKGRRTQEDILSELKTAAKGAGRVLLASDPDREGESIAWHIADALNLNPATTGRIRFNEITKTAIQKALDDVDTINMDRVRAQEARRAMDRVVGFPLSNLLSDKVTYGLSAGRVQSVAVKVIVDRELEIAAFKSEEYWKFTALVTPDGSGVTWSANPSRSKILAKKKGEKPKDEPKPETVAPAEGAELVINDEGEEVIDDAKIPTAPEGSFLTELAKWNGADVNVTNETDADAVAAELNAATYTVTGIEQKDRNERPQPPFITSTLQQQANIRLRFTTKRTMETAQRLYEGVSLDGLGQTALITYMRTDSTRISADALTAVRSHIGDTFGANYVPEKPNVYASGKGAQDGHEAVRPTDVSMTPTKAANAGLLGDQLKLYTLIYNRFVACQMMPALFAVTSVEITAAKGLFRASGRIMKFDGYRKVMSPASKSDDTELPALAVNQKLSKLDLFETQHFTQPPPRYNEASLVKTLEKEGIGRPSTYSSIISTIQDRGYVEQKDRRFFATPLGIVVTKLLVDHFPKIMDLKFTSHFEEELDEIETGKFKYEDVLNEFWTPFKESLEEAKEKMPPQKAVETGEACPDCGKPLITLVSRKTKRPFVGCSGYRDDPACRYIKPGEGEEARPKPEPTEFNCPKCGKMLLKRAGKTGPFLGCSDYPKCKTTMNFGPDGQPVPSAVETEFKCEKCQSPMIKREGKAGPFLGCSAYPKCKNVVNIGPDGQPVKAVDLGINCDKCGSPMTIKRGPRGPFLACTGYPKCRNAKNLTDELKEQLKDHIPAPAPKKEPLKVEVTDVCPECNNPMRLQKSRFGGRYFLGCTKYPKCKGTAKVSEALQAKITEAEALQAATAATPAADAVPA